MSSTTDSSGEAPRRPRLVLPGSTDGPARPKIVLPGLGLVDPNAPPASVQDSPAIEQEIPVAENVGFEESPPAEIDGYDAGDEQNAEAVAEEAPLEPVEEFLTPPEEATEATDEYGRVPELRAAPAELKDLSPRRLGPPPGWESEGQVPAMEVETVSPSAVWEEPVEFTPEATPQDAVYEGQYEEQPESPYEVAYGEAAQESGEPEPAGIPVRPLSSRLPTPLTSPHSDRPATRRVTHQVRPTTGPVPHSQSGIPAPQGQPTQSLPTRPGLHAPPQRLLPSWVLVMVGFLVGAVAAILAVVKSPLRDKIGLMERSQANAYTLAVLKEERSQVQAMLNTYYRNSKISLAEEMSEFRTEEGRKAPEKMTLQDFAAEIKEQEAIKKEEEEADKKAAEEEAKAKEEEANAAEPATTEP